MWWLWLTWLYETTHLAMGASLYLFIVEWISSFSLQSVLLMNIRYQILFSLQNVKMYLCSLWSGNWLILFLNWQGIDSIWKVIMLLNNNLYFEIEYVWSSPHSLCKMTMHFDNCWFLALKMWCVICSFGKILKQSWYTRAYHIFSILSVIWQFEKCLI